MALIGRDGPAVVLDARMCAWLEHYAGLSRWRVATRGTHPQVAAALEEIRMAAEAWREGVQTPHAPPGSVAGSDDGTSVAALAEPEPSSSCWLSTSEVGVISQVSPRAVVKAIARGDLPAEKLGRVWRIAREDAEHYRIEREGKRQ